MQTSGWAPRLTVPLAARAPEFPKPEIQETSSRVPLVSTHLRLKVAMASLGTQEDSASLPS